MSELVQLVSCSAVMFSLDTVGVSVRQVRQ